MQIFFFAEDILSSYSEGKINLDNTLHFIPDLQGPYQLENYRTCYAACKALKDHSIIKLKNHLIEIAFTKVAALSSMVGRWQWLNSDKKILIDSAHNEDGIRKLSEWMKLQNYKVIHIVMGFVKDKELSLVFQWLPKNAQYYFTQAKLPRALPAEILREQAMQFQLNGKAYKRVSNAFIAAKKKSTIDDLIVVCGSIFVVAEVL